MSISPARAAAFDILLRVEQTGAYASELLHSSRFEKLGRKDHGLATDLVMGVLRWRSLLDAEIARFSSQQPEKLDLEVLTALRLAGYQLWRHERIPARAAVHESVELVKHARKRSAAPFVNALLRKMSSDAQWIHNVRNARDGANIPALLSQGLSARAVELASRFAHPVWLVERWLRQYGLESVGGILAHDQQIPEVSIVAPAPEVQAELQHAGIILQPGRLLKSAFRIASGNITRTTAFRQGHIAIQDEASQLVALLAGKGPRILDCCAAPGGKTRMLAERNPDAQIIAVELHPHRARLLRKLVPAGNVRVVAADICDLPVTEKFDCVLADVPCSGTGTLARNPEIKWRLKPQDLPELQQKQQAILRSAMQYVAPGGRLVYSTCSLEKEENADVVERAFAEDPSFQFLDCRQELERLRTEGELAWPDAGSLVSGNYLRTLPGVHPCDGFFAAILHKK